MSKFNLAVLVKVDEANVKDANVTANTLDELRQKIFQDVRAFIASHDNNNFSRCVPASSAWGQKLYERFGVVFGATEPALFSYYFVKSRIYQDNQIMKKIASNGVQLFDNHSEESGISTFLLEGNSLLSDPWIKKLLSGGFLYNCGIYSIHHQKAALDEADYENVRKNHTDYAICVLDVLG